MRKRNVAARVEVENPEVKARVLAVLQALSGEKSITEICEQTGLKQVQYYKLEGQMIQGMVLAAQSSLTGRRGRSPLAASASLEDRNQKLREENLRVQSLLRLTRKLFRSGRKPRGKRGPGRPPKGATPPGKTEHPGLVQPNK